MAEFELQGMESLLAKFDAIKQETKYKGGRAALRKAANFVADKAKQKAQTFDDPATAESIAKNIAVRWNTRRFKISGDLAFRIGILGGARQFANTKQNVRKQRVGQTYITGGDKSNPGGDTWYWRFLELGTEKMAARPFLRPALKDNQGQVISIFAKEFEKAIDRAVKREKKKGK